MLGLEILPITRQIISYRFIFQLLDVDVASLLKRLSVGIPRKIDFREYFTYRSVDKTSLLIHF